MLTKKAKYALIALLYLARQSRGEPVLISELAQSEKIPRKFLEQILLELRKKGILRSKKGKGGGYALGRPADSITFGEVIRILDGPLAPVSCVSQTAYQRCEECKDEKRCAIRAVMKEVRDSIAIILDRTSLEDAIRRVDN